MKKLIIISAIALSSLVYNTADAQIGFRVGFRFGPHRVYAAPAVVEQAPVYNDNDDDYYYLPDVDAYYSVNEQCYYYFDGDNWISAAYLPGEYRDYDWRNARRFEVREARPYLHNDVYRSRYNGNTGNWARNNDYNRSGFVSRDQYNSYAGNDHHFDNWGGAYNQPNRSNGGYNQGGNNNNYGSRSQGGFNQHSGNNSQAGYSQPSQPQRNQGGNNQYPGNGGVNNHSGQPDRNPGGGNQHSRNGGGEHRNQGNPQGGFADHRMARY